MGSKSGWFPNTLILFSKQFSYDGESTTATFTYKQPAGGEVTSVDSSSSDADSETTYQLETTRKSVSILQCPDYKNASATARSIAKGIIDGWQPWDRVAAKYNSQGELVAVKDTEAGFFEELISEWRNVSIVDEVLSGRTTWEYSSYKWTVTTKSSSKITDGKLNKKGNPPGLSISLEDGFEWQCTKVTSKKTGDSKWTNTTTYESVLKGSTASGSGESKG